MGVAAQEQHENICPNITHARRPGGGIGMAHTPVKHQQGRKKGSRLPASTQGIRGASEELGG